MPIMGLEMAPESFQFSFWSYQKSSWIYFIKYPKFMKNGISFTESINNVPYFRINEITLESCSFIKILVEIKIVILPK